MFYIVYIVRFQESTCLNLDVSKFSELFHDPALWKLAFRVPADILGLKIVSIHLSFHSFADGFLFNIEPSDSAIDRIENILVFTWDKVNFPNNKSFILQNMNYIAIRFIGLFMNHLKVHFVIMKGTVSVFAFYDKDTLNLFGRYSSPPFRSFSIFYSAFKVLLFFLYSRFFYFLERKVLIIFNLDLFFIVLIIFSMHLFSFFFLFIFSLPLFFCFHIFLFLFKLFLLSLELSITLSLIFFNDLNTLHVHFCVGFVLLKLLQSHLKLSPLLLKVLFYLFLRLYFLLA